MGWRTSVCGTGVGCNHGRPTPLCIVQGAPIEGSFTSERAAVGQSVAGEIRVSPGGALLLDLGPHCWVDAETPFQVNIDVPGEATADLASSGHYDLWVGGRRIAFGPAVLELAVTAPLAPRRTMAQAWSPVLTAGQEFSRLVLTDGMVPAGEFLARSPERAPSLHVRSMGGEPLLSLADGASVRFAEGSEDVHITLSAEQTARLGPGRFVYTLNAYNDLHEPLTLLAGVLLVEEGGRDVAASH